MRVVARLPIRPAAFVLALWPAVSLAVIETYEFESELLRQRYLALSEELRCPKCQNQNIADSNAPIAADLRAQLHEQLHAERSDQEIADYMVQRYGKFVLYRPRWSVHTAALWLAPAGLLLLAVVAIVLILRHSGRKVTEAILSDSEKERLRALLEREESTQSAQESAQQSGQQSIQQPTQQPARQGSPE